MLESRPGGPGPALDEAKALGADVIRANVIWSRYAPSPTSTKKPKGFDGKNPTAYPAGVFAMLDSLRRRRAGARPAGAADRRPARSRPGPRAARARSKTRSTCKPDPKLVRRLRARPRHALPDREDVVDLERAEPAARG